MALGIWTAPGKVISWIVGGSAKAAGTAAGAAAGPVATGAGGVVKATGRGLKLARPVLIPAAIVAGVTALGLMARSMGNSRRYRKEDHDDNFNDLEQGLPPVVTGPQMMQPVMPQDMAPQQVTMMGQAPTPGDHANRVLQGRGLAPQQQAPVNPAMNVASDVQDLGAVPPQR